MKKLLFFAILFAACAKNLPKPHCDIPIPAEYAEHGYTPYHDLAAAQKCAEQTGRPILILFTSYSCVSSYGLFWEVLREPDIKQFVEDNYIFVLLHIDDRTPLEKIDSTEKHLNGKIVTTVGAHYSLIEARKFNTNSLPFYAFVDSELNVLAEPLGYTRLPEKAKFMERLQEGVAKSL
jgi:thioredoxin-related protein